jgi:hypothetical protein
MDPRLDPEHGGDQIQDSTAWKTPEEAKAEWKQFKVDALAKLAGVPEELKAVFNKLMAFIEYLLSKV